MWTYILKDDYEQFINQYYEFENFASDLILLETDDAYFLPRLFAKNYPSQFLKVFNANEESFKPTPIKNIDFKGKLREEQVEIIQSLSDIYQRDGYINGIVKARPGLG